MRSVDPGDEGLDLNLDEVKSVLHKLSVKPKPVALAAAVPSI